MSSDQVKNDAQKLQWLGGALIVLSLILLYCWSSKKNKYEGYVPLRGGYLHGARRMTDGFSPSTINTHLPDLNLQKNRNLNDMENYVVNRHTLDTERKNSNVMGMRWNSEAFVSGRADEDQFSSGYDDPNYQDKILTRRAEELVGSDIMTPMKPNVSRLCGEVAPMSSMQILHVDSKSHMG